MAYCFSNSLSMLSAGRAAHLEALDPLTGEPTKLFHPRHDTWPEHFQVDAGTGELQGRTAIGRATVSKLQMNSSTQLAARQMWMRLRMFQ